VLGVLALQGTGFPWGGVGVLAVAWIALTAGLWLDAATWRRRLPFALGGDDRIEGEEPREDDRVPWIAVEVRIFPRAGATSPALTSTLEILASRVNRAMRKDDEARFSTQHRWRVEDNGVAGQVDRSHMSSRLWGLAPRTNKPNVRRPPRARGAMHRLGQWSFSPRASMARKLSNRFRRVSGFFAEWSR